MAIQAAKTLANGASGNYWKITSLVLAKPGYNLTVAISLFADQAHANAGAPSLGLSKTYSFVITQPQSIGDLLSLAYADIMTKAASIVNVGNVSHPFDPDLVSGIQV